MNKAQFLSETSVSLFIDWLCALLEQHNPEFAQHKTDDSILFCRKNVVESFQYNHSKKYNACLALLSASQTNATIGLLTHLRQQQLLGSVLMVCQSFVTNDNLHLEEINLQTGYFPLDKGVSVIFSAFIGFDYLSSCPYLAYLENRARRHFGLSFPLVLSKQPCHHNAYRSLLQWAWITQHILNEHPTWFLAAPSRETALHDAFKAIAQAVSEGTISYPFLKKPEPDMAISPPAPTIDPVLQKEFLKMPVAFKAYAAWKATLTNIQTMIDYPQAFKEHLQERGQSEKTIKIYHFYLSDFDMYYRELSEIERIILGQKEGLDAILVHRHLYGIEDSTLTLLSNIVFDRHQSIAKKDKLLMYVAYYFGLMDSHYQPTDTLLCLRNNMP